MCHVISVVYILYIVSLRQGSPAGLQSKLNSYSVGTTWRSRAVSLNKTLVAPQGGGGGENFFFFFLGGGFCEVF